MHLVAMFKNKTHVVPMLGVLNEYAYLSFCGAQCRAC